MPLSIAERLDRVLHPDDLAPVERDRLIHLMLRFAELPAPPDRFGLYPRYEQLKEGFLDAIDLGRPAEIEERFLELYAHLHMHEAPYTPSERRRLDASGGYWNHAGGLSPVLKAGDWIRTGSSSADLGAGNGLQAMLLQVLYPHRRSYLLEISGRMVRIGRDLQHWLEIPENRITWIVADILDVPVPEVDFLYLYRPVRPEGPGGTYYRRLAGELEGFSRAVVVFSIADCLGDYLSKRFRRFYSDGHLTCYQRSDTSRSGPRR